jgi:hypothetical protein
MPQPRTTSRTALSRLLFLAVLGWALVALSRRRDEETGHASATAGREDPAFGLEPTPVLVTARRRTRRKRLASSLAFATLFFAGAALSAGAGDMLVETLESTSDTTTTEATTTEESSGDEKGEPGAETPADESGSTDEPTEGDTPADTPPGDGSDGSGSGTLAPGTPGSTPGAPRSETPEDGKAGHGPGSKPAPPGLPLVAPHSHLDDDATSALDPEAGLFGGATVWLHTTLPDPVPYARRLTPAFARMLRTESNAAGTSWARVLAAVRADGGIGRVPASRARVRTLAAQLADVSGRGEWNAFLALRGRTTWADRAQALARFNRAVGLEALVKGLDASKRTLETKVLADARISIYPGGRSDIAAHGIDVRILVLLRYLAEAHGTVTVSSLHSGHRYYSRPGVVSAHMYGLAVDIATLGGRAIYGNSAPGGLTEQAVRDILLLPAELRPRQVISLLGLGGPSFPLADHDDHIHVGY